jgi:cyclopropane fatty-acyl-phospholipid synthase-like methyltransferase
MSRSDVPPTDAYAGYARWKGWQGGFEPRQRDARYFAAEFAGLPLAGRRVLEIGFGEGRFLAWSKAQGAEVSGLEINPDMLEAAARHGYSARNASLADLARETTRYDLIVAFDVIEHWDTDELIANFGHISALLVADGVFLARFPNGHSPFGRIYQHGDFTHKSVISAFKIDYLAGLAGLEVARIANVRRVSSKPGVLRALRHRWMALRRAWIERSISRLYGTERLPLDPNLVAVLRKPPVAAGAP